jgi:hypothetical protein
VRQSILDHRIAALKVVSSAHIDAESFPHAFKEKSGQRSHCNQMHFLTVVFGAYDRQLVYSTRRKI